MRRRVASKTLLLYKVCVTLPETNIAPENEWLEYKFPFGMVHFQEQTVSFREGLSHEKSTLNVMFPFLQVGYMLVPSRVCMFFGDPDAVSGGCLDVVKYISLRDLSWETQPGELEFFFGGG